MAYETLDFQTPVDLLLAVRGRFVPYRWQVNALVWIAGYHSPVSGTDLGVRTIPTAADPFYYTMVAANGSGKDSVIGAGAMMWFLCTGPRRKAICTSASAAQLFEQTETPCRNVCDAMNGLLGHKRFDYVLRKIIDTRAQSSLRFFATDDPGKAEGDHPAEDYPDAEMMVVMNEVKTMEESITDALERNTGYNYWIEYSSPGEPIGHFWEACQLSGPRVRVDKITAYDCPNISAEHIKRMIGKYGLKHPIVRSSILAEFSAFDTLNLIPIELVQDYQYIPQWRDTTLRAGLDLGLGIDEAVLYVYLGPKFVEMVTVTMHDAVEMVSLFVTHFKRLRLSAENINVDGSGIGKPILSIFKAKGWNVQKIRNDEAPKDKGFYLNRGAEMWDHGRLLLKAQAVELPRDRQLVKELTTRRADIVRGRARLEGKREARQHGRPSPNRADAWMLCFARVNREEMGISFDERGKVEAVQNKAPARPVVADGEIPYELLLQLTHGQRQRPNRHHPTTFYT